MNHILNISVQKKNKVAEDNNEILEILQDRKLS